MVVFVDLGFSVEPLQESGGKDAKEPLSCAVTDSGTLDSSDHERD